MHEDISDIPPHHCYKNWPEDRSLTSMESDIIIKGLQKNIGMLGVVFKRMNGDGD